MTVLQEMTLSSDVAEVMPEEHEVVKDATGQVWNESAQILSVIAHPVRLAILDILCQKPRCVKHINALVPLAQSHLSQHLRALRNANLVANLSCGALRCYYILRPTLVQNLLDLLCQDHPLQRHTCTSLVATSRSEGECTETGKVA